MAYYYDTSAPGNSALTATKKPLFSFGTEVKFYASVASNLISGQATGPSVQFLVYSRGKKGLQTFNVDYGTTNTSGAPVQYEGYMVEAIVPTGAGSVNCRVVLDRTPVPLTVLTVAATVSGPVEISGTVDTDVGQGTAPKPNVNPQSSVQTAVALYATANPTLPHSATASVSSGTAISPALSVTDGQYLYVIIAANPSNAGNVISASSITDSQSNTWTKQGQLNDGSGNDLEVWTAQASATGTDTLTITLNHSASGGAVLFSSNAAEDGEPYLAAGAGSALSATVSQVADYGIYFGNAGAGLPTGFTSIAAVSGHLVVGYMPLTAVGSFSTTVQSGQGLGGVFSILSTLQALIASAGQLEVVSSVSSLELNDGSTLDAVPFDVSGTAKGDLLYNNGTDWVNLPVGTNGYFLWASGGLPAWVNLYGTAGTWSALQTFGNHISFGGATVNVSGLASTNLLAYNGTNWVNATPTSGSANYTSALTISSSTGAGVMLGIGKEASVAITPVVGTTVVVTIHGTFVGTAATLQTIGIISARYSTGTAPSTGASATGTAATNFSGTSVEFGVGNSYPYMHYSVTFLMSVTPGDTYWVDLAANNSAAVNTTFNPTTVTWFEIP